MKKKYNFTLVELMTVIAIIAVLASILIPVTVTVQKKAKVTAAKADMAALISAIKTAENTYGKLPNSLEYKSDLKPKYVASNGDIESDKSDDTVAVRFGGNDPDVYNYFIAEMTDPNNGNAFDNIGNAKRFNKRRIKLLDAKSGYNPSVSSSDFYTDSGNADALWRDPWGTPYVIIMASKNSVESLPHPAVEDFSDDDYRIMKQVLVYSFGPNGEDNHGINSADDGDMNLLSTGAFDNYENADDIVSWK